MLSESTGKVYERHVVDSAESNRNPAFIVSHFLELKSFQQLSPEDQFRLLAERLCGDLKAVGISMSPYASRSLLHFRAMPPAKQTLAVERLTANYLALEHMGPVRGEIQ